MQPKRPIPLWVIIVAGATIVPIVLNIAANRIDGTLVDHYGGGYPMQFILAAAGWQFTPHIISVVSMVAVIALWWWSQSALPPERVVETVIEYRDPVPPPPPPPAISVTEGGLVWVGVSRNSAWGDYPRPECPEHEHQELSARHFVSWNTSESFDSIPRGRGAYRNGPSWVPYCEEGKHDVPIDDARSFDEVESAAQRRIDAERRRMAAIG